MNREMFGDGKYIVYANDKKEAKEIFGKETLRVNKIKYMLASILDKDGEALENFKNNIDNLRIFFNGEDFILFDSTMENDNIIDGVQERRKNYDGGIFYDMAYKYLDIDGHNPDYRVAREMVRLMLNPDNVSKMRYNRLISSSKVSGLIRAPLYDSENKEKWYGKELQESAINVIAQIVTRGLTNADNIISGKENKSEKNQYTKLDPLVKMLIAGMRNDFKEEHSFEYMVEQGIDKVVEDNNYKKSMNTFFYGILNDSSIIEEEFNKYSKPGNTWKYLNELCKSMCETNISKEKSQAIYNEAKMLIYDFDKTRINQLYKNEQFNSGKNIPSIENKMNLIKEIADIQDKDIDIKNDLTPLEESSKQDIKKQPIKGENHKIESTEETIARNTGNIGISDSKPEKSLLKRIIERLKKGSVKKLPPPPDKDEHKEFITTLSNNGWIPKGKMPTVNNRNDTKLKSQQELEK